jgi:hypothetical protein
MAMIMGPRPELLHPEPASAQAAGQNRMKFF